MVEAAAIVLSILLAFAIDAWWDGQRERAEEQEILLGLHDEFTGHVTGFRWRVARTDSILGGVAALMADDRHSLLASQRDSAMMRLLYAGTVDPGRGVRDALLSSGRLELLHSDDLRNALAAWEGVVAEVQDDELVIRTFTSESVIPYLAGIGDPFTTAYSIREEWPVPPPPENEVSRAYEVFLGDSHFQALLAVRYHWTNSLHTEYQEALTAAEGILAVVERELDR